MNFPWLQGFLAAWHASFPASRFWGVFVIMKIFAKTENPFVIA
jgi:hypothetical protein